MFVIRDFIKLFFMALIALFVQIIPAYAAIQTDSIHRIDLPTESAESEHNLIETIHAPPKIVLSLENDFTVETFYPEEISYDIVETNESETKSIENNSYTVENLNEQLPRITLTVENELIVETFYPSSDEEQIFEKQVVPLKFQENNDMPARVAVISLSLDGTNSVQYFEHGEPYLQSLNFVVGESSLSEGYVFCVNYMQYL